MVSFLNDSMDFQDHIISQLSLAGRTHTTTGDNIMTHCHNVAGHPYGDRSPSLSFHRSGVKAMCWGCGWVGSWSKYAKEVGLEPIDYDPYSDDDPFRFMHRAWGKVKNTEAKLKHAAPPHNLQPWTLSFRNIPAEFMARYGVRFWLDDSWDWCGTIPRMWMPAEERGELIGWTSRAMLKKDAQVKHRHMGGEWARKAIFLLDHAGDDVVLVEGPTDTLVCRHLGIPACGILGTRTWDPSKDKWRCGDKGMKLIQQGVKRVFLLMDGDSAGRTAATIIKKDLHGILPVEEIKLPEDKDPGDLMSDPELAAWVKGRVPSM